MDDNRIRIGFHANQMRIGHKFDDNWMRNIIELDQKRMTNARQMNEDWTRIE